MKVDVIKETNSNKISEKEKEKRTSSIEWPTPHYDLDVAFPARIPHDWSVSNCLVSLFGPVARSASIVYVYV